MYISAFPPDALTKVCMHFYKPPQADILVMLLDLYLNFYDRDKPTKKNLYNNYLFLVNKEDEYH